MNDTLTIEVSETVLPVVRVETLKINPKSQLDSLVDEINYLSIEIKDNDFLTTKHGKISLNLAIRRGELLFMCKQKLKFGKDKTGWETWFDTNIKKTNGFTLRTAQYDLQLFKFNTKHASFFDDCFSIREAQRKIKEYQLGQQITEDAKDVDREKMKQASKERAKDKPKVKQMTAEQFKIRHGELYNEWRTASERYHLILLEQIFKAQKVGQLKEPCDFNLMSWNVDNNKIICGDEKNRKNIQLLTSDVRDWFDKKQMSFIADSDEQGSKVNLYTYMLYKEMLTATNPNVSFTTSLEDNETVKNEYHTLFDNVSDIIFVKPTEEETELAA